MHERIESGQLVVFGQMGMDLGAMSRGTCAMEDGGRILMCRLIERLCV